MSTVDLTRHGADTELGVLLGSRAIMTMLIEPLQAAAPQLKLCLPEAIEDPKKVTFALAWDPSDRAFEPYPNLKLVSSIAAGVNAILACPSLPHSVPLIRITSALQAQMMAGFVTWHVLWHHRGFGQYLQQQQDHEWYRRDKKAPQEVRVGVMGQGCMGRAVSDTLVGLGYDVAVLSRTGQDVSQGALSLVGDKGLDEITRRSDILVNLLPLTPQTEGMLNDALFSQMPQHSVLIHMGRGEQLVEDDLLKALDQEHLSGASLDVFMQEPLPSDHPFWAHPRIVVTPHDACEPTASQVMKQVDEALVRVNQGEQPPGLVDYQRGY